MKNFFKKFIIKSESKEESKIQIDSIFKPIHDINQTKEVPINNITHLLTDTEIEFFVNNEIFKRLNPNSTSFNTAHIDSLFEDAAKIVVTSQIGSASNLQRKLKLGYNRANRIIEQLEATGIVGAFDGSSTRRVLIFDLDSLNHILDNVNEKNFLNPKEALFFEKYFSQYENEITNSVKEELKKKKHLEETKIKEEIKQNLLEKERIKRLAREAKKELLDEGLISNQNLKKREHIPTDVKDMVWNRDGGKCVQCGSNERLEFDHIIPFIKGGSNTYRNLQLLCEKCNREKSAKIG